MKRLSTWFLALFMAAPTLSLAAESAYFSPADNLESLIKEGIESARRSLDVSIYSFSSRSIRAALVTKAQAGIPVRIIMEKGNSAEAREFLAPLIEAGAEARYVTQINHHKFVIVDGKKLLNSSGNFSASKSFDENLLVCTDCAARVAAYQSEFDALFANSNPVAEEGVAFEVSTGPSEPIQENVDGVALFSSANFAAKQQGDKIRFRVVGPHPGSVATALSEAIDGARREILVATGHFRSKPLYDALKRAVERGIDVQVVLDSQEYISAAGQAKQDAEVRECLAGGGDDADCHQAGYLFSRKLDTAGVDVRMKYYSYRWNYTYAPQMHHKYMLIDGRTLYTGSYNWSNNAEYNTFENVTVTKDADTIASYKDNFSQIQGYGDIDAFIRSVRSATDTIELHFDPQTATVKQVDKLREAAVEKCPRLFQMPATTRECSI